MSTHPPPADDTREGNDSPERALGHAFVDLAYPPDARCPTEDVSNRLVGRCQAHFGVEASVIHLDDGGARVTASTSSDLERLRLDDRRRSWPDPSLECAQTGEPASVTDAPQQTTHWPDFRAALHRLGFQAAHALPVPASKQTPGVLTLYEPKGSTLRPADLDNAHALGKAAEISLQRHRAAHRSEVHNAQLEQALESRIILEQAKGLLAAREGIGLQQAFTRLRSYARSHRLRLHDVAHDLVLRHAGER